MKLPNWNIKYSIFTLGILLICNCRVLFTTPSPIVLKIPSITPTSTPTIITQTRTLFSIIESQTHTITIKNTSLGGGGKIVYSAHVSGSADTIDTYLFDIELEKETPLIVGESLYKRDYSWAPNGKQIIFMAGILDLRSSLVIVDIETRIMHTIISSTTYRNFHPSWSPDGNKIAFASDRDHPGKGMHIYIMNIDGNSAYRLSNINCTTPNWSPDGRKIAASCEKDGEYGISIINTDNSDVVRLSNFGFSPNWSSDGKKIIFEGGGDKESGVFTIGSDGSNLKNLIRDGGAPSWSPDGEVIVFGATFPNGHYCIYLMDSNGNNVRLLPTIQDVAHPMWSR
jgi:Tol biopolymer transport system component